MKHKRILLSYLTLLLSLLVQQSFAQELTRKDLVEKALDHSHLLKIKENEIKSTEYDKQRALYTYIPKVGVKGGYAYLLNDINISRDMSTEKNSLISGIEHSKEQSLANLANSGLPPTMIGIGTPMIEGIYNNIGNMVMQVPDQPTLSLKDQNLWFYDAYVEMVIFSGLQAPNYAKAAEAKANGQRAMLQKDENEIITETVGYYDKLAVIAQSLVVLEESQKRLDKQKQFAEKAKEVGLATDYDLNKIRIAEKDIVAKRIELNASRNLVVQKLQQLTGLSKEELITISPQLEVWWVDQNEINLGNRAEIKAIDFSVEALERKHKAEQYSALPKAKAFAHVMQGGSSLTSVDPIPFVGVGMQWEIFDGLQRKREVQKSELAISSMREKKAYAEELVSLDFEKKKMEWEVATQMVDVAKQKLDGAETGLKIRSQELKNGLADVNDILEEISDYEKLQLEYIQSVADQRTSAIALLDAMGVLNVEHIQK
ncbi:TolC family protein [Flammeovirga agarivorans]|uniref:TolC family protein n=1 Tax=Flammeovirga agarivorans TaxID=2726742 RepID=A0A7X8XW72_9BACT|nr:TolC family protein [Flammeovirga agarivorans]NLR92043.1 TolC family protein [Flammeovirga agarivorans]